MSSDRPYANFIGVEVTRRTDGGAPLCVLKPGTRVSGAPGMLHGGAIAGLLETAAGALVEQALGAPLPDVQPVSITVDYLRTAELVETRADAEIVRQGARIVHVDATAWQDDQERPVAMARLVFSLRR